VKLGKADETVDIQLNQESSKFKTHLKHLKRINDNAKKVLVLLKDLAKAQGELTEDINALHDSGDNTYKTAIQLQYTMQDVDQARLALEEQWRDDFQLPLSDYIGQFHEIEKRLDTRDKRRIDMDRFREEVKHLSEKGNSNPEKIQRAKEKLQVTQESYKEINSELLRDIPALFVDRVRFFEPVFATICEAYIKYYTTCYKSFQQLIPFIQHVDRSAVHRHPKVITDRDLSAAYAVIPGSMGTGGDVSRPVPTGNAPTIITGGPTGYPQPTPGYPPQQQYPPQGFSQTPGYVPPQQQYPPQGFPQTPGYVPPQQNFSGGMRARALYPFQGQDSTELSFQVGDIVTIRRQDGEWWEGELNGHVGLLPANYVQLL